jgi:hypothetical protein
MKFVLDDVIGIKAEDDIGTVKVFKTLDDFLDFIEDINDSLKVEVVTDGSWEEVCHYTYKPFASRNN